MRYDDSATTLVQAVKQRHDTACLRLVSEMLAATLRESALPIDLVIPVPMHWRRNLAHGNNHSALLARQTADILGLSYSGKALEKKRHTPSQRGLTAPQRRRNLRRAFACPKPPGKLKIAVVDDVITTASTMNEIAGTLKLAGADAVYAVAVARAVF